jgi:TonB-dependent starch-binding outer membrane protein SusC
MKAQFFLLVLLFVVPVTFLSGQNKNKKITITGVVTDINKKPVSGTTILVDNKNTNKVTDAKGVFKIRVNSDARKISALSISGATAETVIDGKTEINLSLPIDATSEAYRENEKAGEENINVGYGSVKKKNLSTPVGKIDGNNKRYGYYQNIYEMLRGQPGVQVNGTSVKIQGASSFLAGTEPLYVVDGIPVTTISDIQPQDVKSIEILKGSSASIYGSRGANGVVLITLIGTSGVK